LADLRGRREPYLSHPGPAPGARCPCPPAPTLCPGDGRLEPSSAENAKAFALADVLRPVPFKGGPPFPFSARYRRAANHALAAFTAGCRRLQRRGLARPEDDGTRAPGAGNQVRYRGLIWRMG